MFRHVKTINKNRVFYNCYKRMVNLLTWMNNSQWFQKFPLFKRLRESEEEFVLN